MTDKTASIITGVGVGTMLIVAQLPVFLTAGIGMITTAGILYLNNKNKENK